MIHPRLTLRLGFAGRKDLSADETKNLRTALTQAYTSIGAGAIARRSQKQRPQRDAFTLTHRHCCGWSPACARADALAAAVLNDVTPAKPEPAFVTELAAVLPFSVVDYRANRPTDFLPEFDAQLARCA